MSEISTAVEKRQESARQMSVTQALTNERITSEIQRALPRHMDGDRMARIALTLVRQSDLAKAKSGGRSKSLSECNAESFVGALMTASALGLEPGVNGECYLIPYGTEATLQIGYQGMLKLAWQHPIMRVIDSGYVLEGDEFEWEYGFNAFLRHKPTLDRDGKLIAVYAIAELKTGARSFVVLSPKQISILRGVPVESVLNPPQINSGRTIKDPEHQMSRKTALRQLLKPLPKSVAAGWAHQVDEQQGSKLVMDKMPEVIAATVQQEAIEQGDKPADVTPETLDGPAFPEDSPEPSQTNDPWTGR